MTAGSQATPAAPQPRRPIATRERPWARALARLLIQVGVSPDAISFAGVVFGALAGYCLWRSGSAQGAERVALLVGGAAGIQLRLLCNMLDGMVAIEGDKRSRHGELLNDMPDRFADLAVLVPAGYSLHAVSWGPALGWAAGTLALLTAYVRLLGGSMGVAQYFIGPMAKPHRMAVMTVACVVSIFEPLAGLQGRAIEIALIAIIVGSVVTIARRTARILADLER